MKSPRGAARRGDKDDFTVLQRSDKLPSRVMRLMASHGGSGSDPKNQDGPRLACQVGHSILDSGGSAIAAAVAAAAHLEDDIRFNAGTGSNLRLDGKTIEMDAACMTSAGTFGAVAAIERVRNPVHVARRVLDTPHILLAGSGATAYARRCGYEDYDVSSPGAILRLEQLMTVREQIGEWSIPALREAWNFETPLDEVLGCDTVGALAYDGESFAGALSSGGTTAVLRGRVGDVPLPGCGLYVGPRGAVAATGDGEYIAQALLAHRAYLRLESGQSSKDVLAWALAELPVGVDVGLIVADRVGFAGGARSGMAWHGSTDGSELAV